MHLSRAEFLRLIAGVVPASFLSSAALAQGTDDERRARVASVIAAYDAQGVHRTGTEVDDRSARWLLDEAVRAGGNCRLEPFRLDRLDIKAALLRATRRQIEGLPLFDGGITDAAGIVGRLGPPSTLTEIALVRLDQAGISSEGQSLADLRRASSHRAIVAITDGNTPGLSPSNAAMFAKPYGVPVLQVGSEHQEALATLAQSGEPVNVVVHAERIPATAQNVVVNVEGKDSSLAPLVVMTPRSGWWHCASERGGGLACWLEALRAVAAGAPARPVILVASSGHELGHYGLDAFIAARAGLVKQAAAWVHLGANIGAANGVPRLQAADDEIERLALTALEQQGMQIRQRVPRGNVPGGEARNIHLGGGRYVSLLGSGPLFHNIKDRFPDAVDVDAVTKFAAAIASLALSLASA